MVALGEGLSESMLLVPAVWYFGLDAEAHRFALRSAFSLTKARRHHRTDSMVRP